ncbi:hypothetical protein FDK30_14285, partial [Citrobacter freundii]|uniref:hypothetical protein n=1 Tax=Citrobacter freundii TaxID=546 RepID=UPI001BA582BF
DQIAQSGLSSLSVIYYSAQLFRIAKAAFQQQTSVKQVVLAENLLTPEQADYLLDPMNMTDPQKSTAVIKRYQKEMNIL